MIGLCPVKEYINCDLDLYRTLVCLTKYFKQILFNKTLTKSKHFTLFLLLITEIYLVVFCKTVYHCFENMSPLASDPLI